MIWRLRWPRIWRVDGFKLQSKSKSKVRRQAERDHILLCSAFCSIQATMRFWRIICFTRSHLLYSI